MVRNLNDVVIEPSMADQSQSQWGETYNHVFGRTTNPYNRYLTPGGSSGGEGALVAMKGSPLGEALSYYHVYCHDINMTNFKVSGPI